MAIVPSGKQKLMKLQQSYNVTDQDGEATQSEVKPDQGNAAPAFDWNGLQNDMNKPSVAGPHYGEEDFQQAAKGGKMDSNSGMQDDTMWDLGRKGANIRAFVFHTLEELGAPPRLIMDSPDTFFKGTKDLDTGILSGSYILPSYTKNRKIPQEEAETIAMRIGQQFGLSQKLSPQGRNYKIDFRTRDNSGSEDFGTSLQELAQGGGKGGQGGQGGQQPMARASSSDIRESIKRGNRNTMYEKLKELGFGG